MPLTLKAMEELFNSAVEGGDIGEMWIPKETAELGIASGRFEKCEEKNHHEEGTLCIRLKR